MDSGLQTDLERDGYYNLREIEGRGICGNRKFMFTTAILFGLDEVGYRGRWCYGTSTEAEVALEHWSGLGDPPLNWIKYKGEGGERSNAN